MKILASITKRLFNLISVVFIISILFIIPLKILSYGWSPNYAMLITSVFTKSDSLPVSNKTLVESVKSNKPIYDIAKEKNLVYLVTFTFVIFNLIGFCVTENPIAWFAAMILLMLTNGQFIVRILSCSPQIMLSLLLLILIPIFSSTLKEKPKSSSIALILYIFMLRTIIPPEIYSLDSINIDYKYIWALPLQDLVPLITENCWLFYVPFIMLLHSYKSKTKFIKQLDDSILFVTLLLQLIINFGFIDLALFRDSLLLIWFTQKFSEIIKKTSCFKEPRVKYSLSLFVIVAFILISTHDESGRYSKHCIEHMPIDFSMKELKNWAPEPGGIIYNDDIDFAFSQYYYNPDANYSYIYLNSFSLFKNEKSNLLDIKRMLKYEKTPLPDYYEEWVEQMQPADRLITSEKINGLENIEWLQCGQKRWIGRKKII